MAEYQADKKRKHAQKINRTNALSITRDILIGVIIKKKYEKALEDFYRIVSSTREIVRPGRTFNKKTTKKNLLYELQMIMKPP